MAFPVAARSTGTLISSSIWNADLKDNLNALYAGAMSIASQGALDHIYALTATQLGRLALGSNQAARKNVAGSAMEAYTPVQVLDRDVSELELVSSTTETTMYSVSVSGGVLTTNRLLRLSLIGDYRNNSGSGVNFTARVKLGSTTILTFAPTGIGSTGERRFLTIDAQIAAKNSASLQVVKGDFRLQNSGSMGGTAQHVTTSDHYIMTGGHNGVTENSGASLTLSITYQHNTSSADVSAKAFTVQLEAM